MLSTDLGSSKAAGTQISTDHWLCRIHDLVWANSNGKDAHFPHGKTEAALGPLLSCPPSELGKVGATGALGSVPSAPDRQRSGLWPGEGAAEEQMVQASSVSAKIRALSPAGGFNNLSSHCVPEPGGCTETGWAEGQDGGRAESSGWGAKAQRRKTCSKALAWTNLASLTSYGPRDWAGRKQGDPRKPGRPRGQRPHTWECGIRTGGWEAFVG